MIESEKSTSSAQITSDTSLDALMPDKNNNFSIEIESDSENEVTQNAKITKTASETTVVKRVCPSWTEIATYKTYTEAHEIIISRGFKKQGSKNGNYGQKTNYFCGKVKQKARSKCKANQIA